MTFQVPAAVLAQGSDMQKIFADLRSEHPSEYEFPF
jgi:hypothetical protein